MFADRSSVYIIAEVGSNHGGSFDAALALIDAAAEAGADAAKFQLWHADHMYDPVQFPEEHASAVKWQMPESWLPRLAERCQLRGIDFGCSAFCFDALDAVDPYVKWHKVASIEATWPEYAPAVRSKGKPYLISNGGAVWTESVDALAVVLHCVTAYPADLDECHLLSHPGASPWGLSDHTTHPTIAPCAAVALGASVIEKHLCLHRTLQIDMDFDRPSDTPLQPPGTPDEPHSIEPDEFRDMVDAIRLTEKALGSGEKRIRPSEEKYLRYRRGPRGLRGA